MTGLSIMRPSICVAPRSAACAWAAACSTRCGLGPWRDGVFQVQHHGVRAAGQGLVEAFGPVAGNEQVAAEGLHRGAQMAWAARRAAMASTSTPSSARMASVCRPSAGTARSCGVVAVARDVAHDQLGSAFLQGIEAHPQPCRSAGRQVLHQAIGLVDDQLQQQRSGLRVLEVQRQVGQLPRGEGRRDGMFQGDDRQALQRLHGVGFGFRPGWRQRPW